MSAKKKLAKRDIAQQVAERIKFLQDAEHYRQLAKNLLII